MQKDKKAPVTPRIDVSKRKLLSPYGRNAADIVKIGAKAGPIKTGTLSKRGVRKPPPER